MSKLVDDVKSGLKGIRGAGDAIRGKAMETTDQAFDPNPEHPTNAASKAKNRVIAEKGKEDIRGADETLARREWAKEGVRPEEGTGTSGLVSGEGGAPALPPRDHGVGTGAAGDAAATYGRYSGGPEMGIEGSAAPDPKHSA